MSEEPKLKVLVADDDDDQRYLLTRVLQRAGFATVAVDLGADVVPIARRERPDAIVLDIQMPDQDGFTTGRELKTDPLLAGIPLILLSGRTDVGERMQTLDFQPDAFLRKSGDYTDLVREVRARTARNEAFPPASSV